MKTINTSPALTIATTLAMASAFLPAQAREPISTDRPDFVESSLTVGRGVFQIETSGALERPEGFANGTRTISTPTLLRFGVLDALEARIETDGWLYQRDEVGNGLSTNTSGFSDLSFGIKYHIGPSGPLGSSSALLLHVDVPSGARAFRGRGARPSLRYVAEWEIAEVWAVGIMPGLIWDSDENGRRYLGGIAGLTVAYSWTERFRSFAEIAAETIRSGTHGGTQLTFDSGVAWLLTDDLQIDAAAYTGLNARTPDITLTVGISSRW